MPTPFLSMDTLVESQAQKHVTINDALQKLDEAFDHRSGCRVVTGNATVLVTDTFILVDHSGACTITLPAAGATGMKRGRFWVIKDRDGVAATWNISVAPPSGGTTLEGSTSNIVINTNRGCVVVWFDGTNFWRW